MDPGETREDDGLSPNNGRESPDAAPSPPDASPDFGATPGTGDVNAVGDVRAAEGTEDPVANRETDEPSPTKGRDSPKTAPPDISMDVS